jgi:hypothetical protein
VQTWSQGSSTNRAAVFPTYSEALVQEKRIMGSSQLQSQELKTSILASSLTLTALIWPRAALLWLNGVLLKTLYSVQSSLSKPTRGGSSGLSASKSWPFILTRSSHRCWRLCNWIPFLLSLPGATSWILRPIFSPMKGIAICIFTHSLWFHFPTHLWFSLFLMPSSLFLISFTLWLSINAYRCLCNTGGKNYTYWNFK